MIHKNITKYIADMNKGIKKNSGKLLKFHCQENFRCNSNFNVNKEKN